MAELGKASAETKKAASHAGPAPASFETGLGDVEIREGEAKSPDIASRHAALLSDPRLISRFSPQQRVRLVQHIQRGYGNGHVARVMSQLQSTAPASHSALASATDHDSGPVQRQPAAAAPPSAGPENDPHFKEVVEKIHQVGAKEKRHGPPAAKAAEAQKAAVPPSNDTASQAAAAQVDTMNQQKPGAFDKQAFMNAVRKAIEAAAPSNLDQAEKYKQSGKAEAVKAQVSGLTEKGKEGAQKDIKSAAEAPPDASKAKPKAVTPMNPEDPGQPPAGVGADRALPPPASADQVNLDAGPAQVKDTLAAANVTDQQLANSNEPQFQGALAAKQKVEENAKEAPKQYRQDEQTTLSASKAEAVTAAAQHLGAMHAHRAGTHAHVGAGKSHAKAGDEAKRAEFATKIEGIYTRAKTDVTKILGDLDKSVEKAFDDGEKAARSAFETYIEEKTHQFKVDRYLKGAFGPEKWIIDQFKSPPELNQIVEDGRKLYLKQMDGVISRVADVVGNGLTQAKQRIAQGRQEIQKFIGDQPKELQKIAREAAQDFEGKFNQLSQDVDNKQGELVNTLAQKYLSARDALDKRVAELKDANKSLTDQAVDFAKGVVDTIKGLKDMLLNVLAKAQAAIDKIIADPVGFLGNLVSAVKQGLNQFVANIGAHLKKGLLGWLFGALADAGIQLPETFDLKGILSLVLQVLGLSWANIRSRAAKLLGEPVVAKLEQVFDVFKTIATEGLGGLLKFVQEKFVELKDGVISAIKDWVITKVITAGITWLISMLNPASAFIKACKAIYDVVMFFIERGSQIMSLVNAILDGVIAIANGSLGGAANLVEEALGKAVPVAISFLASLLGLGGISEQIKKVIQTIQAPINKLIDTVIGGAAKYAKKFLGPLLAKVKSGVAKVKQKAGRAKDWVVGKAKAAGGAVKEKLGLGGKADEAKGDKKGTAKMKEHPEIAAKVKAELEKTNPDDSDDFTGFKEKKQAKAKELESLYTPQLQPGIKLSVQFQEHPEHEELDFNVVIAPNTTRAAGKALHQAYQIHNFQTIPTPDGLLITYTGYRGTSFEVRVDKSNMLQSIKGTSLRHKSEVSSKAVQAADRGVTRHIPTHAPNLELNKAHLIPDEFLGPGYRRSLNLITTSDHFNKQTMRDVEKEIGVEYDNFTSLEMELEVEVEWGAILGEKIISMIIKGDPALAKLGEDKVRRNLAKFSKKYANGSNEVLKRVMEVTYRGTLTNERGKNRKFGPFYTGPDLWLGQPR